MPQLAVQRPRPFETVQRHPRREDDQQPGRQAAENSGNHGRVATREVPDVGLAAQATPAERRRSEAEVDDHDQRWSRPARAAGPHAFRPDSWLPDYPYHGSAAARPRTLRRVAARPRPPEVALRRAKGNLPDASR